MSFLASSRQGHACPVFFQAWVHVLTDPDGVMPKLTAGKEITVSGRVNRADLSILPA